MADPNNVCVLVAEVPGADRLADALDATEVAHALERCMHRIDRAIDAHAGKALRRGASRVCGVFPRADAGILAACEMLERVHGLPPLRGLRMTISIGLHFADAESGDAELGATRLLEVVKPGHALASETLVDRLSAATRPLVSKNASRNPALAALGWSAFAVGRQASSALPEGTPDKADPLRARIRHGADTLLIEEQRPVLLFGRELGNDVVIPDPRASRHHARIERRRSGFVLVDQSTNGTFLVDNSGAERNVKGGEIPLAGSGRIGCGFPVNDAERDLVFFEIL